MLFAHLPYLRFPSSQALLGTAAVFDNMGCRLQIHALGNTAVRQALEVVRTLKPAAGASLEHVMVLGRSDLDAFADVPVVASLQPGFIPHYADALEAQGIVPSLHAFPLASLAKRGVKVAISSDAPCGHADPLHNIRCAVHRTAGDGRQIDPREALDVSSAVAAASLGAAQAIGLPPSPLQAGACATFTLLNGHPLDPVSRVVETWIDGRCVWSASRDIDKISAISIQQEA
ncbi:MAG: amidohydrolase family protein [Rhodoferax sp.]|nr:amidohydrolase family protein [Rhodoferax sp.]